MAPATLRNSMADSGFEEGKQAMNRRCRSDRPVRKARKTYEGSPFVDSAIAVSDVDESEDSDNSMTSVTRRRKRKRSPSTAASVESDGDNVVSNSDASVDTSVAASTTHQGTQVTINNMVINVPLGHTGPLVLQLNFPSQTSAETNTTRILSKPTQESTSNSVVRSVPETQSYAGFLDLPAELRNEVYRLAFVSPTCFNFDSPSNFSHSAALLRTCKQVYNEGRSILYSENHFLFVRKIRRHGSYWEREWNEVGFKAVRKFLRLIRPTNIALLRDVTLHLEDATPCLNPGLVTADERRFVFDEVLMSVLKMLAQHAKLRKLQLHFRGRRRVERTDHRFLEKLTAIQADEVKFIRSPPGGTYPVDSKQEHAVERMCLTAMVRKRKIFT